MNFLSPPTRSPRLPVLNLILSVVLCAVASTQGFAQNFRLLHTFDFGQEGIRPDQPLIQGADGRLYGTTRSGGRNNQGTVFAIDPSNPQSGFAVLHHFSNVGNAAKDGYVVGSSLCQGSDGRLYGTTTNGGVNWGTIFALNTDGTGFTVLHQFNANVGDGAAPEAPLIQASDGRLYGTTSTGGTGTRGIIFAIKLDGTGYTIVRQLNSLVDGGRPMGALIEGSDGVLYGTTSEYGAGNAGTIFAVAKIGATLSDGTTFKVLRALSSAVEGNSPRAGLREGTDGRLYGTTWQGAGGNAGTIFALAKDGSNFIVLHTFGLVGKTGSWCASQLVEGSDGRLYGTTDIGGNGNAGVIFAIDKGGDNSGSGYTVLHLSDSNGEVDGARSGSGLLRGTDGKLYGVFSAGGTYPTPPDPSARYYGYGTIYRIAENGSGFTVLRAMNYWGEGQDPVGKPLSASDGKIYGVAYQSDNGGTSGAGWLGYSKGTIYVMNRDGTGFTVLHEFPYAGPWGGSLYPGASGSNPNGDLIEGSDGKLYGTTSAGGDVYGRGEVFRLNRDGTGFAVLTQGFPSNQIGLPTAGVIEGADGKLYGTHTSGGATNYGGLYSVAKDGSAYAILREFNGATDGGIPQAPLVRGSDGRLYGTNRAGGANNAGTIFAFSEGGAGFSVLHHFSSAADGSTPYAGLTVGPDGKLYGTTSTGGPNGFGGTVFSLVPGTDAASSVYTRIRAFGSDFYGPAGGVVFGGDGRLYGVVINGGAKFGGALYSMQADGGDFRIEHELDPDTEGRGVSGQGRSFDVTAGPDGAVYGLARSAGAYSAGTAIALGFPPVITSSHTATGTFGEPFNYTITATHLPLDYDAFPLPSALDVDHPTGLISGTPGQTGNFAVNVAATNAFGSGVAELSLTVNKALASVVLSALTQTYDGLQKPVTVTTTPSGLPVEVLYNGSGTAPTNAGSYAIEATVHDSNYIGSAIGTLVVAKATAGINISNTSAIYDGTPKPVTVTTIPGGLATTVTYNGSATVPSAVGSYSVVATISLAETNYQGSTTATLVISAPASLPVITRQPQDLTVAVGKSATFSVAVSSATPLTLQWRKNGIAIQGATHGSLRINKVRTSDAGTYQVVVTNAAGSVLSNPATLTVVSRPLITTQPVATSVNVGGTATFSVTATSSVSLSYQWRKGNTALAGQTSPTLTIANAQVSDAGNYNVVISNFAGSVTSSSVGLTVLVPPTITQQPQSVTVANGMNVTFNVAATGVLRCYINGIIKTDRLRAPPRVHFDWIRSLVQTPALIT